MGKNTKSYTIFEKNMKYKVRKSHSVILLIVVIIWETLNISKNELTKAAIAVSCRIFMIDF